MINKRFIEGLKKATTEKVIEALYHNELQASLKRAKATNITLSTPLETDGIIDTSFQFDGTIKILKLIIETKLNESFNIARVRAKVLLQVLYYLKHFEDTGNELPNVVFIGDKSTCFVLHTNHLQKYMDSTCDWSIAPSKAYMTSIDLLDKLENDLEIQKECYLYAINKDFEMDDVINRIIALLKGIKVQIRINEKNISNVFDYFSLRVIRRNSKGEPCYTSREQIEYFTVLMTNSSNCYIHPNKSNVAVIGKADVKVDGQAFEALINHYEFKLNAREKGGFTAIADRLIEDSDRRMKGDFYTPTIWVNEAHKAISETLGDNWKDRFVVWDCCWGTGNLTRDYTFANLHCSTLHQNDLAISTRYNTNACKFTYDFLNDDIDYFYELLQKKENENYKITEKDFYGTKLWTQDNYLINQLLEGKELLILMNPPYGTAKTGANTSSKVGIANTKMNRLMKHDKIGSPSQQLYAQFIYRIHLLSKLFNTKTSIAMFSIPLYLTGSSYKNFRKVFTDKFQYNYGMLFQASNFANVSNSWGISFSIWSNNTNYRTYPNYLHNIKEFNGNNIVTVAHKDLYNTDTSYPCSTWIKSNITGLKTYSAPQMTSGIKWVDKPGRGKLAEESLGYFFNVGNNIQQRNAVALFSSCTCAGNGSSVLPQNFTRITSNFMARRLLTGRYSNWTNDKDEFLAPNITHPKYKQWEADSLIYSIFNTASQQTSLRNIHYNGTDWNIYNEFFFMSKEDIQALALSDNSNDDVYTDITLYGTKERYLYTILDETILSADAKQVLGKARELVWKSFKYRDAFNNIHPEYQINNWDCGWYQVKALLKMYLPNELKAFNSMYSKFSDKLRPMVVELGFLKDYPGYSNQS